MDIGILALILVPLATAFLIPLIDLVNAKVRPVFVVTGIVLQIYITLSLIIENFSDIRSGDIFLQYHLGGWQPPFGINLVMDGVSLLFVSISVLSFFLIVIFSIGYIGHHAGKYYVLFYLIIASTMGILLTGDLFNLYVFIEMLTIASGSLIAFKQDQNSSEAAIKYLIYNVLAGLLFFFGVLVVYFNLGSLNMAEVSQNFHLLEQNLQLFIIGIFMTSVLIKAGIFPFFFWLPKSYDSAPSAVTAVLSGILSKAYIYIFIRLFWTIIGFGTLEALNLNILIFDIALLSSFLGHVFALQSNNIKRLLGYSSIGHMGMIVAVIMLNTEAGFYGGLLHVVSHMFMKAGLFVVCGYLLQYTITHHYRDFRGVGYRNKPIIITFITLLLSMIGMPPLLGFASKWYVLMAFLDAESYFGAFIVIFGSITAVIYYLRYIAYSFDKVEYIRDDIKNKIYSRPVISVMYREKIVTFVIYAYTSIIVFLGVGFRFFDIPLRISTESIMNVERYIETVLGG